MTEYRSALHFLIVSQEGDDQSWDLHHPESCNRIASETDVYSSPIFDCAISREEFVSGLHDKTGITKPGIYMLEYWATPSSTAGGVVQDADDGFEVTELCNALSISGLATRLAVAEEAAETYKREADGKIEL